MVTRWQAGFNHPLRGWDHLLAMLAVGGWAAQQRGALRWRLPLTFVAVMGVGGLVGYSGAELPGVEWVIGGSVLIFALLVVSRARLQPGAMMSLVGFFAFFHGFARGPELPGATSLLLFGAGFTAATVLLHGTGQRICGAAHGVI